MDHRLAGNLSVPGLIERRAATPEDEPFLFHLYCAVRTHEFALLPAPVREHTIRMQYAAQNDGYRSQFPGSGFEIVTLDAVNVGRIWIANLEDSYHLVDIAISPSAQGSGIGTALIRELQHEAERAGKPVRCSVFRFNPGSIRFHQRLGFRPTHEDAIQVYLEWKPGQ